MGVSAFLFSAPPSLVDVPIVTVAESNIREMEGSTGVGLRLSRKELR